MLLSNPMGRAGHWGTQSAQVDVMQQPDLHCHPSLDRALLDGPGIVIASSTVVTQRVLCTNRMTKDEDENVPNRST